MANEFRHIVGMRVDAGTYESTTSRIESWAKNGEARYVCVSNVHMAMETVDSPAFKEIVNSSDLVTSDGMPLVWMLKRLGLPKAERVYGPTLVLHVCQMAEANGLSIGLYGGTDESLDTFKSFLNQHYPTLKVPFSWAPPFRPLTPEEDDWAVEQIASSQVDILFVGIGCPKQERWMHAHRTSIKAVQLGVGAAFDFHSGSVKQAPSWMQNAGLEWLFRLTMEPGRLWRRYVLLNPRFMARAVWQLLGRKLLPAVAILLLSLLLASFTLPPQASTYWVKQNHPAASDANPGTEDLPWKTIGAAMGNTLGPGDQLFIGQGLYRESIRPLRGGNDALSRILIAGIEGEQVIVSGANLYGVPERISTGSWRIANYNPLDYYGDDELYYREMVIADGKVLKPVFNRSDVGPGTFFVDPISREILFQTSTNIPPIVELANRSRLFKPGARDQDCGVEDSPGWIEVRNITFRHAANPAQYGALCPGSQGSVFRNVHVEWTNGVGIRLVGRQHSITASSSNHNGQAGINGTCSDCSLLQTETSYNNWRGHDPFWEAGGGKWIGSNNMVVRNLIAKGNDGPGIWFDGDNRDISVTHSLLDSNLVAGVFLELNSTPALIDHVTVQNTRRDGWSGAGILVQATHGITITNSKIMDNDGAGIWFRADERGPGGYNSIAFNSFSGNVRIPGQDRADIQIEAPDLINLCSNRIVDNLPEESVSTHIQVESPSEVIDSEDVTDLYCLVSYQ
ncbi:MAG: WecB/TagA/CpsF family glycosyltransferase [Bacteroidetes Order II. Incertae sedis bacterium]|nr:WecB/TagA/CpsF family glycosyltransferase [Bacteroidetes Order II. bacterium]